MDINFKVLAASTSDVISARSEHALPPLYILSSDAEVAVAAAAANDKLLPQKVAVHEGRHALTTVSLFRVDK